jgi:Tol biopolymer transport system component
MAVTRVRIVLAFCFTATLVAVATPAQATVPGANGRIAFGSDRFGRTHNIFTMSADGSHIRQLTFLKAKQGAALDESWSPDGTGLVYEQRNSDGSVRQIFEMNADGSGQHQLFSDPSFAEFNPSFSPDGSRVIFSRCRPDSEACAVYSVKADGHGLVPITHFDVAHNVFDQQAEYSPTGRSIAFASFNRGGVVAAVYVMRADGSHVRIVTPTGLEASQPDWSPDGSRIVFGTNCCNPRHPAIWTVGLDGSALKQLTFPGARYDFTPKYSPAGDRVVFERDSADFSTSSIMIMKPDGTGVAPLQADAFLPSWGPAG